jgi:hypothetical protein
MALLNEPPTPRRPPATRVPGELGKKYLRMIEAELEVFNRTRFPDGTLRDPVAAAAEAAAKAQKKEQCEREARASLASRFRDDG